LAVVQKPQVDLSTFTGASKEWNGDGNPVIPNKRTCTPEPKRNNWVETIYPFSTSFHIFKRCFQVSSLRWTFYLFVYRPLALEAGTTLATELWQCLTQHASWHI